MENDRNVEGYVRQVADLLGLRDWTFEVECREVPADGEHGVGGECRPIPGRRKAHISLFDAIWSLGAVEQRNTVVHELIHCHFAETDTYLQEMGDNRLLSRDVADILRLSIGNAVEFGVDAMTTLLAPLMPAVPWVCEADSSEQNPSSAER